jgi:adenine phosphoribosyltransferase
MGFGLGGAIAHSLGAGLVHVRKPYKISWVVEATDFVDYSRASKSVEIASDAIGAADRVVVVDDWSETGAQLQAAVRLVERVRATVVGAALLHIDERVRSNAALSGYEMHHLFDH